jgi:hypothetical protein
MSFLIESHVEDQAAGLAANNHRSL